MNLKEIEKIVKLMDAHGLTQFKLQQDDTKLELKKGHDIDLDAVHRMMAASASPAMSVPQVTGDGGGGTSEPPQGLPSGVEEIKSPMVGTFYVASSPESGPFVAVGDKVGDEDTVCVIEAMKVYNEIKAELRGEVIEVLVENGTPVQYGEPLFLVKTS